MGQKVHPEGFRLGVKRKGERVAHKSNWYSDRDYAELLGEDLKISKAAEQGEIAVDIHTARPGIVIGKGGSEVDALRGELERLTGKRVQVNVREVSRPELNAKLVAESIAEQLDAQRGRGREDTVWRSVGRHRDEPSGDHLRGPGTAAHARCGHRLWVQGSQDPD